MKKLQTLKWLTILIPTILVWVIETLRHMIFVETDPMVIGNIIMASLVFIAIFLFMRFIFEAIERMERQSIRQNQEMAVLEERERIAREMHDGFAQVLGYVNATAQATRQFLTNTRVKEAEDNLKELETVARDAYADVREVILQLRTTNVFQKDLIPLLKEYVGRFSQIGVTKIELEVNDCSEKCFSANSELQIIRIIQEALTNIRKHAGAKHGWVRITNQNGQCKIVIEDDGRGFNSVSVRDGDRPRFGLQIMKERAESIRGNVDVTSIPGDGTRVTLTIPSNGRGAK